MTEPARSSRRPGAAPVFWTSLLLFCILLGLLTYRFSIGEDPSGIDAAKAAPPAVRKKVIVRRVVTTVVLAGSGEATTGTGGAAPVTEAAAPEPEAVPVSEPVTSAS